MQRIGVLTGGSDAPGLNAAIRAVVRAAETHGRAEVWGVRNGFRGLLTGNLERLRPQDVGDIEARGGSMLGCDNVFRANPVAMAQGVRDAGLDGLVVIGGNGSLTIAQAMAEHGVAVVGVPKTIDNDVAGTDTAIGFDTAVGVVADACERLKDTAESHRRVMIVEVMGRHAGFIALHGAIAGGADVVLIPEIPFRVAELVRAIRERTVVGHTHTLIVAAEGAAEQGRTPILDAERTATTGVPHLGGIGAWLARTLQGRIGSEVRAVNLAHLQRGGTPSPSDRILAAQLAVHATTALLGGVRDVYAAVDSGSLRLQPLDRAAGQSRQVDLEGPLVVTAQALDLRFCA